MELLLRQNIKIIKKINLLNYKIQKNIYVNLLFLDLEFRHLELEFRHLDLKFCHCII